MTRLWGQVVVPGQQPGRAVDEFAHDVGVAGVPLCFRNDVDQDVVQRDRCVAPPRHAADLIQCKGFDGGVGVHDRTAVQRDDLLAGLICGRPHVRIGLRPLTDVRQLLLERPGENGAEIEDLHGCRVLHQTEQVGCGPGQRTPNVVFAEPVELPQQRVTAALQVTVQVCLHRGTMAFGSVSALPRTLHGAPDRQDTP
ncbi:hypothetical protein GCM10027614_20270 [Micromonospora vulcania]